MDVSHDTSASCDDVWAVLADGWSYVTWVVGAARIRAVDANWPEVGAQFHHSIGVWPALLNDTTTVVGCIPGRELRLMAGALPIGKAEIHLTLTKTSEGCRIGMTERAASSPMNKVPGPLQALAVAWRNKECLRRLAYLAERSTPRRG